MYGDSYYYFHIISCWVSICCCSWSVLFKLGPETRENPQRIWWFCISARHLYQTKPNTILVSPRTSIIMLVVSLVVASRVSVRLQHFFSPQHIGQQSAEMSLQLAVIWGRGRVGMGARGLGSSLVWSRIAWVLVYSGHLRKWSENRRKCSGHGRLLWQQNWLSHLPFTCMSIESLRRHSLSSSFGQLMSNRPHNVEIVFLSCRQLWQHACALQ